MVREYIAVIWPTGYDYREEIHSWYKDSPGVKSISQLREKAFPTAEDFRTFIFDVYKNDDLSREILEYKTGLMMKNEHFICSVFSFFAESDIDENTLDPDILGMKTEIRNIIAAKMDNYYYDILFHVTDTKYEVDYMKTILKEYEIK